MLASHDQRRTYLTSRASYAHTLDTSRDRYVDEPHHHDDDDDPGVVFSTKTMTRPMLRVT